jgi:hypothetical protein
MKSKWIMIIVGAVLILSSSVCSFAQQPQTSTAPLQDMNVRTVQGVGPGYWPTAGSGLTLNVAAGTVMCNLTSTTYAGGTLTMSNNTTNYIYLNTAASCAPATKTTTFTSADWPIAQVVTSGGVITTILDIRNTPIVGGGLTLYPDNYSGADPCAKINNAMKAAIAGQIVDDSARNGTVTCGTNPWAGVSIQVHLKLGCGATYQITATWTMSNTSQLHGCGMSGGTNGGSTIFSSISTTPVVIMGTSLTSDMQVSDVLIDCNDVTAGIGLQNEESGANTIAQRILIRNCPGPGLDVEGQNTAYSAYEEMSIFPNAYAVSGTV